MVTSATPVETAATQPLLGVVSHTASRSGPLFPWQTGGRWRKWAWRKYSEWRAAYRRARRAAQLARLLLGVPAAKFNCLP